MALFNRLAGAGPILLMGFTVLVAAVVLAARGTHDAPESVQEPCEYSPQYGEHLQRQAWAVLVRTRRKQTVLRRLVAGQLTLLEAAAYFRVLDRAAPPFCWEQFRLQHPGACDDERHCREVINFLYVTIRGSDSHGAEVLRDTLAAELMEHLRCGTLRLPEVPGPLEALDEES
jgi:hypothetical protein